MLGILPRIYYTRLLSRSWKTTKGLGSSGPIPSDAEPHDRQDDKTIGYRPSSTVSDPTDTPKSMRHHHGLGRRYIEVAGEGTTPI